FFSSPWGRAMRDGRRQRMLDRIVEVAAREDQDPTRWSPVRVEVLLADLLYADLSIDVDSVPLISDLLRAFVGYCHELRSVPASLTDETMAAVAQWTAELQQEIHDRSEWQWSWSASALAELASATGSVGALRRLEMDRLPDEPFRWASVPGDAVDAI